MSGLDQPLSRSAIAGKSSRALERHFDFVTVEDLLRHYPRRYEKRGELTDLASLRIGEDVTIQAEVVSLDVRQLGRDRFLVQAVASDGRTRIQLPFFARGPRAKGLAEYRRRQLAPGKVAFFAGKVGSFRGQLQLANPEVADDDGDEPFAGALVPIYPQKEKVKNPDLIRSVKILMDVLGPVDDPLPAELRERLGLVDLGTALRLVHRPDDYADVSRAMKRLRFEEAFGLQVVLARRRADLRAQPATPRRGTEGGLLAAFDARLPFELTAGQREVSAAIEEDLARGHPMHRLLQGEVGSGKTVVALRAMLAVVDSGGQAALLAPTEVLAQQHHRSISAMLGDLAMGGLLGGADHGTRVALLTGSQSTAARRAALLDVTSGSAGIVVGTHALLQDPVDFFDLGLVVVDEQHRFGVEQRDALRAKAGEPPHTLVMTATPIPRTVAMTVFGDLDVSTLTELPAGRAPIETHVVPTLERPRYLERTWERVREEVAAGRQVYVVCPRIGGDTTTEDADPADGWPDLPPDRSDEDDEDGEPGGVPAGERPQAIAVLDLAPRLAAGPLQGLRVEVLHGQLPPDQKDAVMSAFAAGEVDVLVATTVIEVGVDVGNATVMVVMDADRFGMSQLHQLRGRVGRGGHPGLCLLVTAGEPDSPGRRRLDAVASTLDGFEISRLDLDERREGDVLGASQSGRRSSLRLLRVVRDESVIRSARDEAERLVAEDPALERHEPLRRAVEALVAEEQAEFLGKT